MTGWRPSALAGASAAILLAACAAPAPQHRYFQPTADQIGPAPNGYGEAVLPRRGRIVVQGDDLAYGTPIKRTAHEINGATTGQGTLTISEDLRKVIRHVEIDNRGFPGDTAVQSAARWADAPAPNLAILALGYGDESAHTPVPAFAEAFAGLIRHAHAQGATVFVVVPPPARDLVRNSLLEPYRAAERTAAAREGAEVFEAAASEARLHPNAPLVPVNPLTAGVSAPVTAAKGVGQAPETYQAIAADMIPYIKIVRAGTEVDPSPQTGQAGSGDSPTVRDSPANPS